MCVYGLEMMSTLYCSQSTPQGNQQDNIVIDVTLPRLVTGTIVKGQEVSTPPWAHVVEAVTSGRGRAGHIPAC